MKVEIRACDVDNASLVTVEGKVDGFNLAQFTEKLDAVMRMGNSYVVFDVRKLEKLNVTALEYLVKKNRDLSGVGGHILFAGASEAIRSNLHVGGFESENFYDTPEQCFDALRALDPFEFEGTVVLPDQTLPPDYGGKAAEKPKPATHREFAFTIAGARPDREIKKLFAELIDILTHHGLSDKVGLRSQSSLLKDLADSDASKKISIKIDLT